MRANLAIFFIPVGLEGMIERLAIDALRMSGQMISYGSRKLGIYRIGHSSLPHDILACKRIWSALMLISIKFRRRMRSKMI